MAIKPVSGEIKSQDINDNFSALDTTLSNLSIGPFDTYTSLSTLQSTYPNGRNGFAVVLESDGKTGYMYTWTGTVWKKGGLAQAMGIAAGQIVESKIQSDLSKILLSQGRNLLKNTTFQKETTSWGSSSNPSATLSVDQNQQTLTSTGTGTADNAMFFQNLDVADVKNDHTYYFCSIGYVTNSYCDELRIDFCNNTFSFLKPIPNQIYRLQGIQKLATEAHRSINIRHIYANANTAAGKELIVSRPIVIDLTDVFGIGNEPSEEECRWLFENYAAYFEEEKVFFSTAETVAKKTLGAEKNIKKIENAVDLSDIVLKNIFPNPSLNLPTYWLTTSVPDTIISASQGVLKLTGNGSANTQRAFVHYQFKNRNTYYVRKLIRSRSACQKIVISQGATEIMAVDNPVIDQWYELKVISDELSADSIYIRVYYDTAESANGSIIEMTKPILIDLTSDATNIPTMSQLENVFSYTGEWFSTSAAISKNKYTVAFVESLGMKQETSNIAEQSLFYNAINSIPAHDGTEAIDIEELTTDTFYPMWNTLINSTSYLEKVVLGKDQSNTWDIWQVKTLPVAPKYKLLMTCNVHGHGPGGDPRDVGVALYYFIKDLVQNASKSPQLEWIYNNVQMIFIPVANPSGFNVTGRYNSRGVDINRNFDYNFPENPDATFGEFPFSEAESQYIRDMVLDNIDADGFVDMHCFMNNPIALLYPAYSCDDVAIGWKTLNEVATRMILKYGGNRQITVTDTPGTIRKWVENKNGIEAIAVEGTVYITDETPHNAISMQRLVEWYGNNIYRFMYTIPWNKNYLINKKGDKFKQEIDESGMITTRKIN